MIKKNFLCVALLCSTASAFACEFKVSDAPSLRDRVNSQGGYPLNEAKCEMLNKKGMSLSVYADGSVLNGVNVAFAVVSVSKNDVVSTRYYHSTRVGKVGVGSQDTADNLMVEAIRDGTDKLDMVAAIEALEATLAKLSKKR